MVVATDTNNCGMNRNAQGVSSIVESLTSITFTVSKKIATSGHLANQLASLILIIT